MNDLNPLDPKWPSDDVLIYLHAQLCAWAVRYGRCRGVPEHESLSILHDLLLRLQSRRLVNLKQAEGCLRWTFILRCRSYYRDLMNEARHFEMWTNLIAPHFHAVPSNPTPEETEEKLKQAMRRLVDLDQRIIELLHWGDLDSEAIAALLRLPVGTVRSRITRAHCRLHRILTGKERPRRKKRNQRRRRRGFPGEAANESPVQP